MLVCRNCGKISNSFYLSHSFVVTTTKDSVFSYLCNKCKKKAEEYRFDLKKETTGEF